MSRYVVIALFLSLFFTQSDEELKQVQFISVDADYFEVDALGNIFAISGSTLSMYNPQNKKLHEYSNAMLGNITSVDVSDPLRLLLFYIESNQVQFLNNDLSEIASPIAFDDHGLYSIEAVCASSLNRIWVFDSENLQLVQLDQNMREVQRSPAIDQIIEPDCFPDMLFEKQNQVFLYCPEYGIIVFDQFGAFESKFPAKELRSFNVVGNNYFYQNQEGCFTFSKASPKETKIEIPDATANVVKAVNGRYYVLGKDGVRVFDYNR